MVLAGQGRALVVIAVEDFVRLSAPDDLVISFAAVDEVAAMAGGVQLETGGPGGAEPSLSNTCLKRLPFSRSPTPAPLKV
ncbi:hypothetical protein [Variovorax defluvii]|uniref:hypothetical protein n=1 Tax=Variovorax defluvii TaxID=913761 RepID=UPI0031E99E2A